MNSNSGQSEEKKQNSLEGSTEIQGEKEQRIRKITFLYYSRKDVQKAIFEFSAGREIVPRYFEGFGKRPDSLQYPGDVFELVRKGATSFHCSEEIWQDPLKISTELNKKQLDDLRVGWDLLFDIDSKYLDYSKILAEIVINILKFYGVKNIGIKFSGNKGFHILVPWKSFPKEINNIKTSTMFPEWPRIIMEFIIAASKKDLIDRITKLEKPSKYVKNFEASKEVMPDLILASSRHMFRMPYSLHEKTALTSAVLKFEELKNFQPKDADPLKVKIRNFMPEAEEGEATELLREALDWQKNQHPEKQWKNEKKEFSAEPIKIFGSPDEIFPPAIKKILQGVKDGKKRSLFILINFCRSIGIENEELEKIICEWNEKNETPLKKEYIKSQLLWSYKNKIILPPNYDKDYYKGIGIFPTEEEIKFKNPVNYAKKKSRQNTFKTQKEKTRFRKKKIDEDSL